MDEKTDEALMAAYVAGDETAFKALFDRYAPIVMGIMRKQIPQEESCRDLVQQTFLHLHRARHDFQPGRRLRPWLLTIAFNLKREHFRRRARKPESELELDGVRDPSVEPTPIAMSERVYRVRQALTQLKDDQREVIVLHWFEELSFKEISEVLGASVGAVKVRAHRGYKVLRGLLGGNPEVA